MVARLWVYAAADKNARGSEGRVRQFQTMALAVAKPNGQSNLPETMLTIAEAMAKLEIEPLPRNYELLHEMLRGGNADLQRDFAALGPRPRQADLDDLGLHYRLAGHCGLAASRCQSEAARLLGGLKEQLALGITGKQAFSRSLEATTRALAAPGTSLADSLRAVDALQAGLAELIVAETAIGQALNQGVIRLERIDRGLDALDAAALQDKLTHLPNRLAFLRRLEDMYRPEATPPRGALLLIDIDDFSRINQTFGERAGDRLLKRLATYLRKSIKKSDFFARIAGDDFAFLFDDIDQPDAVIIAGRLRAGIAEQLAFATSEPGERDHLTVSIGIVLTGHVASAVELQARAQAALAAAKADTRQPIKGSLG